MLSKLRRGYAKATLLPLLLTVVTAIALTTTIVLLPASNVKPYMYGRTVNIYVVGRDIHVNVSVYPPSPYYYYYGAYYYYYYYYYQGAYYALAPLKVFVAVERLINGTPLLTRFGYIQLVPSGTEYEGSLVFHNMSLGSYRVKVMFWNDFLINLKKAGRVWIPMAQPEFKNVSIT